MVWVRLGVLSSSKYSVLPLPGTPCSTHCKYSVLPLSQVFRAQPIASTRCSPHPKLTPSQVLRAHSIPRTPCSPHSRYSVLPHPRYSVLTMAFYAISQAYIMTTLQLSYAEMMRSLLAMTPIMTSPNQGNTFIPLPLSPLDKYTHLSITYYSYSTPSPAIIPTVLEPYLKSTLTPLPSYFAHVFAASVVNHGAADS